jgi:hypothetical protein
MLKHNKALLKNYIKELKPSKRKDNTAFVYAVYEDNLNSGMKEGFLYIATIHNAVKIRLKDSEAVNMIQEGLKIPFKKAEALEAFNQGGIMLGYFKRFRDGKGGFQEVAPEAIPALTLIQDFFRHDQALVELKDSKMIQLSAQEDFLRMFYPIEEAIKVAEPRAVYIRNSIFEGVDLNNFALIGRADPYQRPLLLRSEELSPEYIITPVRYQKGCF